MFVPSRVRVGVVSASKGDHEEEEEEIEEGLWAVEGPTSRRDLEEV